MNLNQNCTNLTNKYVTNDKDFVPCLRNVFSVECPKTLNEINDPSEKLRCEEQFKFIGWKDTNKCWFPEFDGIPTNQTQFNKLSPKDKKECNKLFKAAYLNHESNLSPLEYQPWNTPFLKDDKTIDQRTGRLCPRNKNKFLKLQNQAQRTECSFIYEQGIVDETGAGGCGIFDNEWLGCGENQHYNCDCTKCLDD
jgi:hypothetical protein